MLPFYLFMNSLYFLPYLWRLPPLLSLFSSTASPTLPMITLRYPSSIWGTTPSPIFFHSLISHTLYDHPVLSLFAIAPVTTPDHILSHCFISYTPYLTPV